MAKFFNAFAIGAVVASAAAYSCCFVVRQGECALLFNRFVGVKDKVFRPGFHFRVAGVEVPIFFNTQIQSRELTFAVKAKDQQSVQVEIVIHFCPIIDQLPQTYRMLGAHYDEVVLPPVGNEVLKEVLVEYEAKPLSLMSNLELADRLGPLIRERVKEFGIHVEALTVQGIQLI
jgi:prohibitin 2